MPNAKQTPGKQSSQYDAGQIVHQGTGQAPGKKTRVEMEEYFQNGGPCDQDQLADGCLYNPIGRQNLLRMVGARIDDAVDQYRDAIRAVQFQTMIKKDAELPWALSMLLDIATAHISIAVGTAIKGVRDGSVKKLENIAEGSGLTGWESFSKIAEDSAGNAKLLSAIRGISDQRVDGILKTTSSSMRKINRSNAQKIRNLDDETKKERQVNFLDTLFEKVSIWGTRFREAVTMDGTDVELLAILGSFEPENHRSSTYQVALRDKMKMFDDLHLEQMGRHFATREEDAHPVERDVQLVWVVYKSGRFPKTLAFQKSDGIRGGTLPEARQQPTSFGAENSYKEPELLGRGVPDEFHEVAIQRHRDVWGSEPPEHVIEDIPAMSLNPKKAPPAPQQTQANPLLLQDDTQNKPNILLEALQNVDISKLQRGGQS